MDFITIVLPRQRSGSGFNMLKLLRKINLWAFWFSLLCWLFFMLLFKRNFAQAIENVTGIDPWFILLALSGLSITMGAFGISGINGWLSVLRGIVTVVISILLFFITVFIVCIAGLIKSV